MPAESGTRTLAQRVVHGLDFAMREVVRNANDESRGSDGITIADLSAQWGAHKKTIRDRLLGGTYRFEPLLGVLLPKDRTKPALGHNARPISIPAVRDRVVQRAMLRVMWPHIREQVWTEFSFGGIRPYHLRKHVRKAEGSTSKESLKAEPPRKSVRSAIERVLLHRREGSEWVFETDIVNFFPSVKKDLLLSKLYLRMPDPTINYLIEGAVVTEIGNAERLGEEQKLWNPESGVPQGGILSPVLSNFYLHEFDVVVSAAGFKLVRYVDDLVVMCDSESLAEKAHAVVREALGRLDLEIHAIAGPDQTPTKTRILRPGERLDFLGVSIYRHGIQPRQKKWDGLWARIDEVTDVRSREANSLTEVVGTVNAVVRGWVNSFRFCNLSRADITKIDTRVRDRVGGWMVQHGFTTNRNVLDDTRARLLGLRSASEVAIEPLLHCRSER